MIVSYIALAAVIAFFAAQVRRRFRAGAAADQRPCTPGGVRAYVYSFLAGVLFANSIPHFVHGVSGEYFPAPFFHNLGRGAATNVVNVLWGLFNFGAGWKLTRTYQDTQSPAVFRALVCAGFIAMSIFLSVVFSRGAFR